MESEGLRASEGSAYVSPGAESTPHGPSVRKAPILARPRGISCYDDSRLRAPRVTVRREEQEVAQPRFILLRGSADA